MSTISFELLENGLNFLDSAVSQAFSYDNNPLTIKYGVLHLSAGVDLILKYRLSQEHWSLLFQDIDKAMISLLSSGDFKSVDSLTCIKRLENTCNVQIDKNFKNRIKSLRELRNKMEHFKITESITAIRSIFYSVLNDIINFIDTELDAKLFTDSEIDELDSIRKKLGELKDFINLRWSQIKGEFSPHDTVKTCPKCLQNALVLDNIGRCHFCCYENDSITLANEYISEILHISAYEAYTQGGEYPLYECPSCRAETLIYDHEYFCMNCGTEYKHGEIDLCTRCGRFFIPIEKELACSQCFEDFMRDE